MANQNYNDYGRETLTSFVEDYGGHETIMPVVLVLSFIASAVHLTIIAPIEPMVYSGTIPMLTVENSLLVFLGSLVVTYATSRTRSWEHYGRIEKAFVGFTAGGLLLRQFSATFQNWFSQFGDAGLLVMFILVVITTIIVAR